MVKSVSWKENSFGHVTEGGGGKVPGAKHVTADESAVQPEADVLVKTGTEKLGRANKPGASTPAQRFAFFRALLDANYAMGEAISTVQFRLKNNEKATQKGGPLKRFDPVSASVALAIARAGEVLRHYESLSVGADSGQAARTYDALLKSDPAAALAYAASLNAVIAHPDDAFGGSRCVNQDPSAAKSLIDIMRYMHENAPVAFAATLDASQIYGRAQGVAELTWEDNRAGDAFLLIDLDGKVASGAPQIREGCFGVRRRSIPVNSIESVPLRTFMQFYTSKEAYAVAFSHTVRLFAAKNYLNAQIELGAHNATVECVIEDHDDNNFVRLRYIDSTNPGGKYRIEYLAQLIKKLGFQEVSVTASRNQIDARVRELYGESMADKLLGLTRLLASSRNLDQAFDEFSEYYPDEMQAAVAFATGKFLAGEMDVAGAVGDELKRIWRGRNGV